MTTEYIKRKQINDNDNDTILSNKKQKIIDENIIEKQNFILEDRQRRIDIWNKFNTLTLQFDNTIKHNFELDELLSERYNNLNHYFAQFDDILKKNEQIISDDNKKYLLVTQRVVNCVVNCLIEYINISMCTMDTIYENLTSKYNIYMRIAYMKLLDIDNYTSLTDQYLTKYIEHDNNFIEQIKNNKEFINREFLKNNAIIFNKRIHQLYHEDFTHFYDIKCKIFDRILLLNELVLTAYQQNKIKSYQDTTDFKNFIYFNRAYNLTKYEPDDKKLRSYVIDFLCEKQLVHLEGFHVC